MSVVDRILRKSLCCRADMTCSLKLGQSQGFNHYSQLFSISYKHFARKPLRVLSWKKTVYSTVCLFYITDFIDTVHLYHNCHAWECLSQQIKGFYLCCQRFVGPVTNEIFYPKRHSFLFAIISIHSRFMSYMVLIQALCEMEHINFYNLLQDCLFWICNLKAKARQINRNLHNSAICQDKHLSNPMYML